LARRNRENNGQFGQLLIKVQRRFNNSPLEIIGRLLAETISDVQRSVLSGGPPSEDTKELANYVGRVLDSLPVTFGDRFEFDAQLIAGLAAEYSQGGVCLSSMLVPRPSQTWGHETVMVLPGLQWVEYSVRVVTKVGSLCHA